MPARKPFRHKTRRYHHHPWALGHPDAAEEPAPTLSRKGMLLCGAVLLLLSAPFALAFVSALVLGPEATQRWLASVHAEWLAPWLR